MKTPDEIKKGLECCENGIPYRSTCAKGCPYKCECSPSKVCASVMMADALALIQQKEAENAEKDVRIQQLEAQVPRWISVEERLPDMGVNVLLLHPHMCEWDDSLPTVEYIVVTGELCTAFGCKKKNAWNVHRKVYDLGEERDLSYATHWMTIPTLPEPPKEE